MPYTLSTDTLHLFPDFAVFVGILRNLPSQNPERVLSWAPLGTNSYQDSSKTLRFRATARKTDNSGSVIFWLAASYTATVRKGSYEVIDKDHKT